MNEQNMNQITIEQLKSFHTDLSNFKKKKDFARFSKQLKEFAKLIEIEMQQEMTDDQLATDTNEKSKADQVEEVYQELLKQF